MNPGNFFAELKRRNVYKVAVAYAIVGWLLVQVATQVFPFFEIPNWAVRLIVLAIITGFPIALVIAWAFELTPEGIKPTEQVDLTPSTRQPAKRTWIFVVIIAGVMSLGLFFLGRITAPGKQSGAREVFSKSIAVLPFVNMSSDKEQEYFSDGLSEELIAVLAKLPMLKVIGRSSSFLFKGTHKDSRAIGKKLGVANLLEGTVRREGDRVRIVAELISAADGRELWTETYERDLKDVFAVQSEIAKAVTSQLKIKLLGPPLQSDAAPSNENLAAYTALQQGNFYYQRGNAEGARKAIEFYNEAIRLDRTYALAYADLSLAWQFLGQTGEDFAVAFGKARSAAQTALSLPPNISQAHAAMGGILLFVDQNFDAAANEYRQAEQLAPTAVLPQFRMTYLLFTQGRLEEAEEAARKTLALEPLDFGPHLNLGRILIARGKYDEAETVLRKGIELRPKAARSHMHIAHIYLLKGKATAALEEARLEPAGVFQDYALALAQQAQGDRASADAALQKFIEKDGAAGPFQVASIYAFRKEPDKMFVWLGRCYDEHEVALTQLLTAPFIHDYRSDPRFAALCRKLNLPAPASAELK